MCSCLPQGLKMSRMIFPWGPRLFRLSTGLLAILSGMEQDGGARVVDSFVQLRNGAAGGGGVEVIGPDGSRPLTLREEATAQTFPLKQAGFYQVRFSNGRDATIAVNPDPRESDLGVIPADTLKLWSGSGSPDGGEALSPGAVVQVQRSNSNLWWWFMLLVLFAAVAESIMASRYLGTQREEA